MRCLPIAIVGAVLALGACAPIVWDKPGGTQAEFSVDNARCRMVARGLNSGDFYAQGTPGFVASAALGNAIGTAANQRATYRDCMEMQGYAEHGGPAAAEASYQNEVAASHCGGRPGGLSGEPGKTPINPVPRLSQQTREIHRLLREVLGEEKPAPTPTIPKPRSMSRADVSRELSLDEILKKIERGIAGGY